MGNIIINIIMATASGIISQLDDDKKEIAQVLSQLRKK